MPRLGPRSPRAAPILRARTDHREPHPQARDPLGTERRGALDRVRRSSEDADHAFEHFSVMPHLEQQSLQHMAQLALGISIPATLRELDPCGRSGQVVVQVASRFIGSLLSFLASLPTRPTAQTGGRTVVVLGGHRVRLRAVDRAVRVLRRRVERIQLQVAVPGVHHVMPHARRHDDRPVVPDVVRLIDLLLAPAELDAPGPRSILRNWSLCGWRSRPMSSPGCSRMTVSCSRSPGGARCGTSRSRASRARYLRPIRASVSPHLVGAIATLPAHTHPRRTSNDRGVTSTRDRRETLMRPSFEGAVRSPSPSTTIDIASSMAWTVRHDAGPGGSCAAASGDGSERRRWRPLHATVGELGSAGAPAVVRPFSEPDAMTSLWEVSERETGITFDVKPA